MTTTVAEVPEYVRHAEKRLSAQARQEPVEHAAVHPKAGHLTEGTGGVRKLRHWKMSHDPYIADLKQLLERIGNAAGDNDQVSLRAITEELGSRSFGPLLLFAGLVTLAPIIGDLPGVPTLMAIIVLLVAGQLLIGRRELWLPRWLLERSVARGKVDKALSWMRRPARFIDRLMRPRLSVFVNGSGVYAIAIVCIVIAAATPPMELVPFSANGAGIALTAFGLALIARDGLVALLAFVFTGATLGAVFYALL